MTVRDLGLTVSRKQVQKTEHKVTISLSPSPNPSRFQFVNLLNFFSLWLENRQREEYPILSSRDVTLLNILGMSSEVKQVFSLTTGKISDSRHSLSTETVQSTQFLRICQSFWSNLNSCVKDNHDSSLHHL